MGSLGRVYMHGFSIIAQLGPRCTQLLLFCVPTVANRDNEIYKVSLRKPYHIYILPSAPLLENKQEK